MEFTNEEKHRIDQLYGNDFADIKPEDAMLIGRWEAWKATNEEKHLEEIAAIRKQSEENLRQSREKFAASMNNLQELHDKAVARYERLENGEKE